MQLNCNGCTVHVLEYIFLFLSPPPFFFFLFLVVVAENDVFLKFSACHFCLQGPALQKKIVSILYENESFVIEQL